MPKVAYKIAFNAASIRKDLEQGAFDEQLTAERYSEYAKVPNPYLFVQRAQNMFPHLNCGIASVLLQDALGGGEIVNGTYNSENHTFLKLAEDTIVDITADQYGGPKVYVGPLQKPWKQ